jgi:hypothetical protein
MGTAFKGEWVTRGGIESIYTEADAMMQMAVSGV